MNIVWNIKAIVQASGEPTGIKIAPRDVWKGVKLSQSILNSFKGVHTTSITQNGKIFPNIPIQWYVVEN